MKIVGLAAKLYDTVFIAIMQYWSPSLLVKIRHLDSHTL